MDENISCGVLNRNYCGPAIECRLTDARTQTDFNSHLNESRKPHLAVFYDGVTVIISVLTRIRFRHLTQCSRCHAGHDTGINLRHPK
jgi:hypothetical protein